MTSITIHNFDNDLAKSLIQYSKHHSLSLNKSVKKLLRKALGIPGPKKENFSDLKGALNIKESTVLQSALADFEKIDPENWK